MPGKKNITSTKNISETPLMQQYHEIKAEHPKTVLLFRVGDFYETFEEDAIKLSEITNITLTQRSNGAASAVKLAGFPHHALDTYVPKLVKAGCRVAVCEQLEKPGATKGIVKRGVTELITPGLAYHDNVLDKKHNNYLASLHFGKHNIGLALLDLSTGDFMTAQGEEPYIEKLIESFSPAEIILNKKEKNRFLTLFPERYYHTMEEWLYHFSHAYERLNEHFKTKTLKGFGIETLKAGIVAAGAILAYLEETQHQNISHITQIARLQENQYMWLDKFTIRNLELTHSQHEEGVALLDILDHTCTAMGARMLKRWLLFPLTNPLEIQKRLSYVRYLVQDHNTYQQLQPYLAQMCDLERLIAKVAAKRINPRELNTLKQSLHHIADIQTLLQKSSEEKLLTLAQQLNPCTAMLAHIEKTLQETPPLATNQGNLIKPDVDTSLDDLRKIAYESENYLAETLEKAKKDTGIPSLKIGENKVFGYYLEVRHTHKERVPPHWIRKQTLVNAERYITEELKTFEEKIVYARERIITLEQHLYQALVEACIPYIQTIQQNAKTLAEIDTYYSFAKLAREHHYTEPIIHEEDTLELKEARHPVIEQCLPRHAHYVPNDLTLDPKSQQILLITGPNMGGKSAILRMVQLIVIMAQIGSFVPATHARISIIDKLFSRVGASDNVAQGESTFMVEMNETANIINNLSHRSLIALDELGRGTSTIDGLSIARATIEYLHNHPRYQPKTLFATHYHELDTLPKTFPKVKNYHVAVKETPDNILFLHKMQPGSTPHSFGIQVAKMAGIPPYIISRAQEILTQLQAEDNTHAKKLANLSAPSYQLSLLPPINPHQKLINTLKNVDINTLSPVEALMKLQHLLELLHNNN